MSFLSFHDNNDPYFGMSCRCVKMKFDANENESGPISKDQITALPAVTKEIPRELITVNQEPVEVEK